MTRTHAWMRLVRAGIPALIALCALGCAGRAPAHAVRLTWWIGRSIPAFDPGAAPDPVRWALERALSRSLTRTDSAGTVLPDAAERWEASPDSLRWTFHLRRGLRFTDGTPCASADFARALREGLVRNDHGTYRWLLASLAGADKVRAGKPLTPVGIETPDSATLVLALARPEPRLPERLALPLCAAWRAAPGKAEWSAAIGLGPFRVAAQRGTNLTLLRPRSGAGVPDTLSVRGGAGLGRARGALRLGIVDLAWPLPPGLERETPPTGYHMVRGSARPARQLALVLRADVPPTTRLAARQALAHGIEIGSLKRALDAVGGDVREWIAPGVAPEPPRFDAAESVTWLERGKFTRSIHPTLAFDADGPGALVARALQGEWAGLGIYVELMPLRGAEFTKEALGGWRAQILLVETRALGGGPAGEFGRWVMPTRGPAAGNFRSGWRPPDLPAWDSGRPLPPGALETLQNRLEQERIAIPIAGLDWACVVRGAGPPIHPAFGPDLAAWIFPRDALRR